MATVTLNMTSAEITHDDMRCVFVRKGKEWIPDWFYRGRRRMLRFKDHEWMSVSIMRPALTRAKKLDNGIRFEGTLKFYNEQVECCVVVTAADDGRGFVVESTYTPTSGPIEIIESGTAFECPYEYDSMEESTTVIGQNPVYTHKGGKLISGVFLENALWVHNRKLRARQTGRCWSPILAHHVQDAGGGNPRWIQILGHYDDCTFKELYATPSKGIGRLSSSDEQILRQAKELRKTGKKRGYKYLVGCTNWSSSLLKDPNFVVRKGQAVRQKVTVDYTGSLNGATLDDWLMKGWQRMLAYTFPTNGKVKAWDVAKSLGVDWRRGNDELVAMFHKKRFADAWDEDTGMRTYIDGSRPAIGGYSKMFALQWYGPLAYEAKVLRNAKLMRRVEDLANRHAISLVERSGNVNDITTLGFIINPCIRMLDNAAERPPALEKHMKQFLDTMMRILHGDDQGKRINGDYGTLGTLAETLLLGGKVFDSKAMQKKGLGLLKVVNAQLDGKFWLFGGGKMEGWCQSGHQFRSLSSGRSILANILAAEATGRKSYLNCARRLANYMITVVYSTVNVSPVDDMDTRGWAIGGGTSGRDQWAEMPPLESYDGIRSVAAILNKVDPMPGYYDVLFLAARTGLCMFPAARTHKRVYDPITQKLEYIDVKKFPNERAIFMRGGGFISYECPWDQTLQAPYQSVEPLMNYLTFGGGIAEAADDRVVAIVPDAAHFGYDSDGVCEAHVWNPTQRTIRTTITFHTRPDGTQHRIVAPNGKETAAAGSRDIAISVPGRSLVKVFC